MNRGLFRLHSQYAVLRRFSATHQPQQRYVTIHQTLFRIHGPHHDWHGSDMYSGGTLLAINPVRAVL